MARIGLSPWLWLAVYLAALGGIGWAVVRYRNATVAELSSVEARRQWQEWREEADRQNASGGPVQRSELPGAEPPMLIYLRDSFPLILGAAVGFPALILGFFLLIARGVLKQSLDEAAARRGETAGRSSEPPDAVP